jgi:hypothetical protein
LFIHFDARGWEVGKHSPESRNGGVSFSENGEWKSSDTIKTRWICSSWSVSAGLHIEMYIPFEIGMGCHLFWSADGQSEQRPRPKVPLCPSDARAIEMLSNPTV